MATPKDAVPTWAPATEAQAIDTSGGDVNINTTNLRRGAFVYVGVGGDVKVDTVDGSVGITFKNVPSGSVLPVLATKVYQAGTLATSMVACW